VSGQTIYRRKKRFGSMGLAEVHRLKQLEDKSAKLKQLVADLSLDKAILQNVLRDKVCLPASAAGWSGTRGMPTG